jgi:hypothetical protein
MSLKLSRQTIERGAVLVALIRQGTQRMTSIASMPRARCEAGWEIISWMLLQGVLLILMAAPASLVVVHSSVGVRIRLLMQL